MRKGTESESRGYVEEVDKLRKNTRTFDHYCVVLENLGYHVWCGRGPWS